MSLPLISKFNLPWAIRFEHLHVNLANNIDITYKHANLNRKINLSITLSRFVNHNGLSMCSNIGSAQKFPVAYLIRPLTQISSQKKNYIVKQLKFSTLIASSNKHNILFNVEQPDRKTSLNTRNGSENQLYNASNYERQNFHNSFKGLKNEMKALIEITRVKKPIGYMLLFYPFAFSIAMAATTHPEIVSIEMAFLTALGYFIGCVLMRSSGCIINDLWDVDIDRQVKRTKARPLPSGKISFVTSISAAATFSLITLMGGIILIDPKTLVLCSAFAFASGFYPLAKRVFQVPQLVLGSVFSCGALIGWMHVCGSIDYLACMPLYVACICWTLIYDTIYAIQDKKDDKRIDIHSSVLFMGENIQYILSLITILMSSLMVLYGYFNDQGPVFYSLSVIAPTLMLLSQIFRIKNVKSADLMRFFVSNIYIGMFILAGIVFDKVYKTMKNKKEDENSNE